MTEKLSTYDFTAALKSDEAVEVFMTDVLATWDAGYIAAALGVVARARGMPELAARTGLSLEQLQQSLSADGKLTLETTLAVMKAFGMEVAITVRGSETAIS